MMFAFLTRYREDFQSLREREKLWTLLHAPSDAFRYPEVGSINGGRMQVAVRFFFIFWWFFIEFNPFLNHQYNEEKCQRKRQTSFLKNLLWSSHHIVLTAEHFRTSINPGLLDYWMVPEVVTITYLPHEKCLEWLA